MWHDPLQPASAADGCPKYQLQQFLQPSFRFRLVLIITFVDLAQLQAPVSSIILSPGLGWAICGFRRRRTRGWEGKGRSRRRAPRAVSPHLGIPTPVPTEEGRNWFRPILGWGRWVVLQTVSVIKRGELQQE